MSDAKRKVLDAVEKLNEALDGIAVYYEQIDGFLYGKNYVISKEEEGATWNEQPNHLAVIELSQWPKCGTLDENLFKQVSLGVKMYVLVTEIPMHNIIILFPAQYGCLYASNISELFRETTR